MAADPARFLAEWHRLVRAQDLDALPRILADDVTIGAPPYWRKLEGRDVAGFLLGVILTTIDDFTYHREWVQGAELALEFRGRVGDRELQGIDLITLDEGGSIDDGWCRSEGYSSKYSTASSSSVSSLLVIMRRPSSESRSFASKKASDAAFAR
jgi:hypothetical protein